MNQWSLRKETADVKERVERKKGLLKPANAGGDHEQPTDREQWSPHLPANQKTGTETSCGEKRTGSGMIDRNRTKDEGGRRNSIEK